MPDCSLPGYPNAFVIGDAAYLVDSKSGRPVPGVSQGALQMGRFVARVIIEAEHREGRGATGDRRSVRARRLSLRGLGIDGDHRQIARRR